MLKQITEKEFTARVIAEGRLQGWRVYHTWRSDNSEPGFPDLVMIRGERLVFAELKRQGRKPTKAQAEWLRVLTRVKIFEVFLWWPSDADRISEILA